MSSVEATASSNKAPPFLTTEFTKWRFLFLGYTKRFAGDTGCPFSACPEFIELGIAPSAAHRAAVEARRSEISAWVTAENKCYSALIESVTTDTSVLAQLVAYRFSRVDLPEELDPRTSEVMAVLAGTYDMRTDRLRSMKRKEIEQVRVALLEPLGSKFLSRMKTAFSAYQLQGGIMSNHEMIQYVEDIFHYSSELCLQHFAQVLAAQTPETFAELEVLLREYDLTPRGVERLRPTRIQSSANAISKQSRRKGAAKASGPNLGFKSKVARMQGSCHIHVGAGHTDQTCWVQHPELRPPKNSTSTSSSNRSVIKSDTETVPRVKVPFKFDKEVKRQLGPDVSAVSVMSLSRESDSSLIFVDTCCGHTLWIFKTSAYFDSLEMLHIPLSLGTADKSAASGLAVTGYGKIGIQERIEFCPTAKHNLIGLGRLFQWGLGVTCSAAGSAPEIICRGKTLLTGSYYDSMPCFPAHAFLNVVRNCVVNSKTVAYSHTSASVITSSHSSRQVVKDKSITHTHNLRSDSILADHDQQAFAHPKVVSRKRGRPPVVVAPDFTAAPAPLYSPPPVSCQQLELTEETAPDAQVLPLARPAVFLYPMPHGDDHAEPPINLPKDIVTAKDPSIQVANSVASDLLTLWHNRLGHRSNRTIIQMHQRMLATGMNLPRSVLRLKGAAELQQHCSCCQKSKVRRHSFKHRFLMDIPDNISIPRGPAFALDVTISCDFHVYFRAPSRDGYTGSINFTLPTCSATWSYLVQSRDQFIDTCNLLQTCVLQPLHLHWSHFHADSDPVFFSNDACSWFRSNGISTSSSPTDTPELNAFSEAANKILGETTLSLLTASGMTIAFWGDAYTVATLLKFLLPCRTVTGFMSPFEFLYGHPPDVSFLRTWGCRCWIVEPRSEKRKDWHSKSVEGRLIDYSQQPKGWICWMPEYASTTVSVNVTFDESIPPTSSEYFADIVKWVIPSDPAEKSISDFLYLVGKIYKDDEDGLTYEIVRIALTRERYIVGYIRLFTPGVTGHKPVARAPIHVADLARLVTNSETAAVTALHSVHLIDYHSDATSDGTMQHHLFSLLRDESEPRPDIALLVDSTLCDSSHAQHNGESDPPPLSQSHSGKAGRHECVSGNPKLTVCRRPHSCVDTARTSAPSDTADGTSNVLHISDETMDATCTDSDHESIISALEVLLIDVAEHPDATQWSRDDMLASPYAPIFLIAENKELGSIEERSVIEAEVPIPPGVKPLGNRFVYKFKKGVYTKQTTNTSSSMDWSSIFAKARLTIKGYAQKVIDYGETYAPTGKNVTLRVVLTLCLMFSLASAHLDVDTAFLYAELKKPVYMEGPPGRPCRPGYCLKVVKALYGLKEAPREWHKHLRNFILTLGLTQSLIDHCLFYKRTSNIFIIVLIYVDDILVFAHDSIALQAIRDAFAAQFKIKDIGAITNFLGMQISITEEHVSITQKNYCIELLERYRLHWDFFVSPRKTPLPTGVYDWLRTTSTPLDNSSVKKWYDAFPYMSIVGSILYLAINSRPDIVFAICMLARYSKSKPGQACYLLAHLCSYLSGTAEYGVRYTRPATMDPDLHAWSDASFASDFPSMRSTAGYVVFMCCGPVAWFSKLLTLIAASTMEAEYMAAFHMGQEVIFIRNLLAELDVAISVPTPCFLDAMAAIQALKNPCFHARTKHVAVKFRWTQQHACEDGTRSLAIYYVITGNMKADPLTKSVSPNLHEHHTPSLLGQAVWSSEEIIAASKQLP